MERAFLTYVAWCMVVATRGRPATTEMLKECKLRFRSVTSQVRHGRGIGAKATTQRQGGPKKKLAGLNAGIKASMLPLILDTGGRRGIGYFWP
jgi:hypothetical protein